MTATPAKQPRTATLLNILKTHGRGDWDVYLTEQGYKIPTQPNGAGGYEIIPPAEPQLALQLEHERAFFNWCQRHERIAMYCHYQFRLNPDTAASGPSESWMTACFDYEGNLTPFGEAWLAGGKTGIAATTERRAA